MAETFINRPEMRASSETDHSRRARVRDAATASGAVRELSAMSPDSRGKLRDNQTGHRPTGPHASPYCFSAPNAPVMLKPPGELIGLFSVRTSNVPSTLPGALLPSGW